MGSVTVSDVATLMIGANPRRQSLILTNASASGTVWFGADDTVTTLNGIALLPEGNLTEDSGGTRMYMGDIYGICSLSAVAVKVNSWERQV